MTDLRGALRLLRAELLERTGVHARERRRLDGRCAAVLMYHRVLPRTEAARRAVEPGMFVTPETFARHLDWLLASFRVLPLAEVAGRLAEDRPLPERAVALTFDDGWRDNLEHALPALRRRALPATLFAVTDRVGTTGAFWPDEVSRRLGALDPGAQREVVAGLGIRAGGDPLADCLAHLKSLAHTALGPALETLRERARGAGAPEPQEERELLDWDELATLQAAGVAVESHAASHALLTRLDPAEAAAELSRAREALAARGLGRDGLLAYPSGAFDVRVRGLAGQAGYRAAVTTRPGLASASDELLALPRIGLHEDVASHRATFHRRVPGTPSRSGWEA